MALALFDSKNPFSRRVLTSLVFSRTTPAKLERVLGSNLDVANLTFVRRIFIGRYLRAKHHNSPRANQRDLHRHTSRETLGESLFKRKVVRQENKRKKNTTSAIHTETNKETKIPSSTVLKLLELAYSGRVHKP